MQFRNRTTQILAETIAGDNEYSFGRTGAELVVFFNEFGFNDRYGKGFPTRWVYAEEKIKEIIKQGDFTRFLNYALDESKYFEYQESEYEMQDEIVAFWNKYLKFDGYEIIRDNNSIILTNLKGEMVEVPQKELEVLSTEFMTEQISKCEKKINEEDFNGAITNARSLVEEVLLAIEERATGERGRNDGDMSRLYNRVKPYLNFDPSQEGINEPLKQILSGLNSIVIGLGRLRSKASDAHAPEAGIKRVPKHHAVLAVNASKTFTLFVLSSLVYREEKKKQLVN
ncbi:hypothetical protein COL47_00290 [Bacillus toyonensis]|uniref:abortive infection family protein n=1 Tax=Bacillus toyonensis TaxID=155322 RepID=UPI000BF3768C|nr:abortive infection family protein [Bacillus toyonensis]PFY25752.1 hypothetical protein COL47_00290 [Bacillus toyonensis]